MPAGIMQGHVFCIDDEHNGIFKPSLGVSNRSSATMAEQLRLNVAALEVCRPVVITSAPAIMTISRTRILAYRSCTSSFRLQETQARTGGASKWPEGKAGQVGP